MKFYLTLLAITLSYVTALYSNKDPLTLLNQYNFNKKVLESSDVWIVEFFAPWCGHCKNLVPEYKKAAGKLNGIVSFGAIDCDQDVNKPLCGQYGIKGFPTIKIFPGDKTNKNKYPIDYNGARTAAAISSEAVNRLPSKYVLRVGSAKGKISISEFYSKKNETMQKVLLFTDKSTTSPLFKSLSLKFKKHFIFGEVSSKDAAILDQFGVKKAPTLLTIDLDSSIKIYDGELKGQKLRKYLKSLVKKDKESVDDKEADNDSNEQKEVIKEEFDENIPQISNQKDFEQYCTEKIKKIPSSLCLVVFLPMVETEVKESVAEHESFVQIMKQLKKELFDKKTSQTFPKAEIMWSFGYSEHIQNKVIGKFGLSSDLPSAFILQPVKKVYKPYIGAFDVQSLSNWVIKDLSSQKGRVFQYSFDVDFGSSEESCTQNKSASCSNMKTDDPLQEKKQKPEKHEEL